MPERSHSVPTGGRGTYPSLFPRFSSCSQPKARSDNFSACSPRPARYDRRLGSPRLCEHETKKTGHPSVRTCRSTSLRPIHLSNQKPVSCCERAPSLPTKDASTASPCGGVYGTLSSGCYIPACLFRCNIVGSRKGNTKDSSFCKRQTPSRIVRSCVSAESEGYILPRADNTPNSTSASSGRRQTACRKPGIQFGVAVSLCRRMTRSLSTARRASSPWRAFFSPRAAFRRTGRQPSLRVVCCPYPSWPLIQVVGRSLSGAGNAPADSVTLAVFHRMSTGVAT